MATLVKAPASQAINRYLAEVTPTKKTSTQKSDQTKASTLRAALGGYGLAAITPDVIAGYRDQLLNDGKARDTVRLQLALLSHIFETAIKEWRIGLWANPCRAIRAPKPGKLRDRRLSADEEQRLLEAADRQSNPMLGWMIRLALATAMRVGEIQRLRRADVDLNRRTALFHDTKNNQTRLVPLSAEATRVLRQALNNPVRPIDCDLIFFGKPGRVASDMAFNTVRLAARKTQLRHHQPPLS